MSDNLLNILSDSNKDIDNQKLMDYISGRLNAEDRHEVESWMIDNPFFSEAVEGLQQAGGEKKVKESVDQINKQLERYLKIRKSRKSRRRIPEGGWTYVAIIIILLLAVLLYLVISRLK